MLIVITANISEHSLCASYDAKFFTFIILFNPYNSMQNYDCTEETKVCVINLL